MLDVKIVCVGKLKEKYWTEAVNEYSKRLSAFCKFSIIELNEAHLPQDPNASQIEKALGEEAENIAAQLKRCAVYTLCIEGKPISSEQLAAELENTALSGSSSVAFVIGSSHGLHESIKKMGKRISMSPMTFPHQLARVMLCEQIYRAFSIQAGTKYHK